MHLFDFDKVIYGEQIKVEFIEFLRDEKTYSSKEELLKQINEDIKRTKAILERK
ncbi:MAG: riboflavin kinase [Bacilli bacterium]